MSTLPYDSGRGIDHAPAVAAQRAESTFDDVVSEFEGVADAVGMPRPSTAELRELCRQVVEISQQVFPGDVRIEVGRDWEIPDDIYFVVDICWSGSPDEFIANLWF